MRCGGQVRKKATQEVRAAAGRPAYGRQACLREKERYGRHAGVPMPRAFVTLDVTRNE